MNPSPLFSRNGWLVGCAYALAAAIGGAPATANAQAKQKYPASKVYVSDVSGDALIETGEIIEDLNKRSVYVAEGTVVETKKPTKANDQKRHYSTMVYSNGTGAFFDADTRVEVKRFIQEPFTPTRGDVDVEPSITQTQAYVARGSVGLCNSKMVAGSNMTYQTPQASVSIRGRKVVIEAGSQMTKISMLEGESTIRGGAQDGTGGRTVKSGEQAIIRQGADGQPNEIVVRRIPPEEMPQLDDKVAMACMAKRTVYFEERVRKMNTGEAAMVESEANKNKDGKADSDSTAATPARPNDVEATSARASEGVTAFESTTASATPRLAGSTPTTGTTSATAGRTSTTTVREIVPVEVAPVLLPSDLVVSPARIAAPGR